MITIILQIIGVFVVPYLIIRHKNFRLTRMLGTIGMAYLSGLVVAGLVLLVNVLGADFALNTDIGEITSFAAIGIGIPLLLFSSNLKEAKKLSKMVLLSFGILIISVIVVTSIVFYSFGSQIPNGAELSAAAIGLYTGGTPNLNAITNIFGLDSQTIALANLSDIVIGAVFYVFLLTLAKPLVNLLLKKKADVKYLTEEASMENTEEFNVKDFKTNKALLKSFLLALGMAIMSALIGVIIWIIKGSQDGRMLDAVVPALLIGVTVFGIAASFNKKIRETKGTNILGHYLILVFSFALASSVNFSDISGDFGKLLLLYGVITVGSFMLSVFVASFFRIDTDCMIVCATAGIYGPAFVPAITKQIKNDALTVPGLIVGSIGYAIGTFLGLLLGLLFMI
jgi:uncharacterized membrane protein